MKCEYYDSCELRIEVSRATLSSTWRAFDSAAAYNLEKLNGKGISQNIHLYKATLHELDNFRCNSSNDPKICSFYSLKKSLEKKSLENLAAIER